MPLGRRPGAALLYEVAGSAHPSGEIGVADVHAAVDDRHLHALPARPAVGLLEPELGEAVLELVVRIAAAAALQREELHRLDRLDPPIVCEPVHHLATQAGVGNLEHGAMDSERLDRPLVTSFSP